MQLQPAITELTYIIDGEIALFKYTQQIVTNCASGAHNCNIGLCSAFPGFAGCCAEAANGRRQHDGNVMQRWAKNSLLISVDVIQLE